MFLSKFQKPLFIRLVSTVVVNVLKQSGACAVHFMRLEGCLGVETNLAD